MKNAEKNTEIAANAATETNVQKAVRTAPKKTTEERQQAQFANALFPKQAALIATIADSLEITPSDVVLGAARTLDMGKWFDHNAAGTLKKYCSSILMKYCTAAATANEQNS